MGSSQSSQRKRQLQQQYNQQQYNQQQYNQQQQQHLRQQQQHQQKQREIDQLLAFVNQKPTYQNWADYRSGGGQGHGWDPAVVMNCHAKGQNCGCDQPCELNEDFSEEYMRKHYSD